MLTKWKQINACTRSLSTFSKQSRVKKDKVFEAREVSFRCGQLPGRTIVFIRTYMVPCSVLLSYAWEPRYINCMIGNLHFGCYFFLHETITWSHDKKRPIRIGTDGWGNYRPHSPIRGVTVCGHGAVGGGVSFPPHPQIVQTFCQVTYTFYNTHSLYTQAEAGKIIMDEDHNVMYILVTLPKKNYIKWKGILPPHPPTPPQNRHQATIMQINSKSGYTDL